MLENEQIVELLETLDRQSRALKEEAIKFSWYMRGGITYEDAIMLSSIERELIANLIKENLETTKKSGLPFF